VGVMALSALVIKTWPCSNGGNCRRDHVKYLSPSGKEVVRFFSRRAKATKEGVLIKHSIQEKTSWF